MSTHRDPRTRRAHRLAAVAGGLPPGLAAAEADPDEPRTEAQKDWDAITPRTQDQLNAAVRLELGLDDWRTQARTEHQLDDADADGIVTATGAQLGGHAMAVWALRRTVGGRPGPWFGLLQSYGDGVGHHGELWIHHADLAHLLAGVGEAAIPLLGTGGQL
jgi:hypothetical protein